MSGKYKDKCCCKKNEGFATYCLKVCDGNIFLLGDPRILERIDELDEIVKRSIFYLKNHEGTEPHGPERITEVKWCEKERIWMYSGSQKWMYSYLKKQFNEKEFDKFGHFTIMFYDRNEIIENFENEIKRIRTFWFSELSSCSVPLNNIIQLVLSHENLFKFNLRALDALISSIELIPEECVKITMEKSKNA